MLTLLQISFLIKKRYVLSALFAFFCWCISAAFFPFGFSPFPSIVLIRSLLCGVKNLFVKKWQAQSLFSLTTSAFSAKVLHGRRRRLLRSYSHFFIIAPSTDRVWQILQHFKSSSETMLPKAKYRFLSFCPICKCKRYSLLSTNNYCCSSTVFSSVLIGHCYVESWLTCSSICNQWLKLKHLLSNCKIIDSSWNIYRLIAKSGT